MFCSVEIRLQCLKFGSSKMKESKKLEADFGIFGLKAHEGSWDADILMRGWKDNAESGALPAGDWPYPGQIEWERRAEPSSTNLIIDLL